ncbi:MAG: hypothetical protein D6675_15755 [Gemmatimonadetes bacterium]|nr:MAG: hypothetical protein D6675_15755 [Gemmatimonadota bacterium]
MIRTILISLIWVSVTQLVIPVPGFPVDERLVGSNNLAVETSDWLNDMPHLAISALDGSIWITWQRKGDATESLTFTKFSTDNGQNWEYPPPVESHYSQGQLSDYSSNEHPKVAISALGGIMLLWQETNIASRLYDRSFYPQTGAWRGPHSFSSSGEDWDMQTNIAASRTRPDIWAVWYRRLNAEIDSHPDTVSVMAQQYVDGFPGRWQGNPVVVAEHQISSGSFPAIAVHPQTYQPWVVASFERPRGSALFAYRHTPEGWQPLSGPDPSLPEGQLTPDGSHDTDPAIFITEHGQVWLAWARGESGARDIWLQSLQADVWDEPISVELPGRDDTLPGIVVDPALNMWVTWQSNTADSSDIYYRYRPYGTEVWSSVMQVNEPIGFHRSPQLAVDVVNNRVWVVWEHSRDIFARWLKLRPVVVQGGFSPANDEIIRTPRPRIQWNPVNTPLEIQYHLQLSVEPTFNPVAIDVLTPPGEAMWQPDNPLQDNQRWYYRVRTVDAQGDSSARWSSTQSFVVDVQPEAPATPLDVIPEPDANQPVVTVRWQFNNDPDPLDTPETMRYQIQIFKFQKIETEVDQMVSGVTRWTSEPLLEDQLYEVWVRAVDASGLSSGWTGKKQFSINTINNAPQATLRRPMTPNTVWTGLQEILWEATDSDHLPEDLTIQIDYSNDGGVSWRSLNPFDAEAQPMAVNDGRYVWDTSGYGSERQGQLRLTVSDPLNSSDTVFSEIFSITTAQVDVLPRVFAPSTGEVAQIWFSLDQPRPVTIQIYNIAGRLQRTLVDNRVFTPEDAAIGVLWDGRDRNGKVVPDHLYICAITLGTTVKTQTVVVAHP